MPPLVKFLFSLLVAAVSVAACYFQAQVGQVGPSYAALALGLLAIVAMWLFPEVSRKNNR